MKVLIDNGHGYNTSGKCSPDGRLKEWKYAREIADMVVDGLEQRKIDVDRIVNEDFDISLAERCKRANEIYLKTEGNVILVSIHCNAAVNGISWLTSHGWSVFVSNNASDSSKILATSLANAAIKSGVCIRQPMPSQVYWNQNLAICRDTYCPTVLTENFFQDNKKDVDFLLSAEGKRIVANIHIEGIVYYLKMTNIHI